MTALLPPITTAARRGIDVLEALRGALSALSANLLRSILTALGIFIGVAAVIATVAVGEGARRQVLAQIQSLGANLLIVWGGSATMGGVRLGAGGRSNLSWDDAVAIARAIVGSPDLILADEPTGALDTRTGLSIMALFQALNRDGVGILMVTHDADVARFAERVLRFRDGRLIADETQNAADAAAALAALPEADVAA